MNRACPVCQHPNRRDIDMALSADERPLGVLANLFEMEVQTLRRHKESHFKPQLPTVMRGNTDPVTLLSELDVVKQTAQMFVQAAQQAKVMHWECPNCQTKQDHVEGADLKLGVMALREWRQTLEATIKIATDLGTLAPNSRQFEKGVNLILKALEPFPEAKDAVLSALTDL